MKMKHLAGILVMALLLAMPTAGAQQRLDAAAVRDDLAALQRMYAGQFRATPFPGIYQMVRQAAPSPRITAPILMTRNAEFTFNNGALGAQDGETGRRLGHAEWGALVMRWRQSLRLGDFIQYGGDGPLRMVVMSGFDCPYSRALETALRAAKARYAVVPGTIGTANQRYLGDIWCASDRAAAWHGAMMSRTLPPRAPASCRYDADYFGTLQGMLGGSLPMVLYADGTIGSGGDPTQVLARLAELNGRDVHF